MAQLLVRARKTRWLTDPRTTNAPADALSDLNTKENVLSAWYVDDDHSNLEDVIVAVASNREHLQRLDFALFDEAATRETGVQIIASPGKTPLGDASEYHRDLVSLTADDICHIAEMIHVSGSVNYRTAQQVGILVGAAFNQGRIGGPIPETLRAELMRKGHIS